VSWIYAGEGPQSDKTPRTFEMFLNDPGAREVSALVISEWFDLIPGGGPIDPMVEELVAGREKLLNLRAIFIGEITQEESEISWIVLGDFAPLLGAYPQLEELWVRGGGPGFGKLRLPNLRTLVVQSGGLDRAAVNEVANAEDLSSLEHLELWLGTEEYGGDSTIDDVRPILAGDRFPKLKYLGLRNADFTDDIAEAVVSSPLLERIEVLDLSMGTLGDRGAKALLACPAIRQLKKLDVHHHYCSEAVEAELRAMPIEVDASEREEADKDGEDEYRYVAVSE
jgi:hypothetical protein